MFRLRSQPTADCWLYLAAPGQWPMNSSERNKRSALILNRAYLLQTPPLLPSRHRSPRKKALDPPRQNLMPNYEPSRMIWPVRHQRHQSVPSSAVRKEPSCPILYSPSSSLSRLLLFPSHLRCDLAFETAPPVSYVVVYRPSVRPAVLLPAGCREWVTGGSKVSLSSHRLDPSTHRLVRGPLHSAKRCRCLLGSFFFRSLLDKIDGRPEFCALRCGEV